MNRTEKLEAALDIPWAKVTDIAVSPARRLTGPGLLWDHPGVVIDITLGDIDPSIVADLWALHARRVLDALGWEQEYLMCRRFCGGVNLAISAPMDQLYSAVFAAQVAWHYCAAKLADKVAMPFDAIVVDLKKAMAQEANPDLIALIAAAEIRGVDVLVDDDEVSLGHGSGSVTWPIEKLPTPQQVNWYDIHNVPIAFITGTNGKTTTTRLCAAIVGASAKIVGLTSTDVVQVGGEILDRGDYSGPGGARMVLRDRRVEFACLEVARGGILRRGLATRRARVAVVTNVAKDHLGEYGVMTMPELAQAKFAVARTLSADGILVLNADDPVVVDEAKNVSAAICWFSMDASSPQVIEAKKQGQPCAYLKNGDLVYYDGAIEAFSVAVQNVPITFHGAAKHNVRNSLAAICVAMAMGIPTKAIQAGIIGFASDPKDNPGRFNEFQIGGGRLFVDYAHNPHSITAVVDALALVPAERRIIMISQPGDRSDQDISDASQAALKFGPDLIFVAEIPDYLRGRKLGETSDLIAATAKADGVSSEHILLRSSPVSGVSSILEMLQPGDLVLLLVLADRGAVFELLSCPKTLG